MTLLGTPLVVVLVLLAVGFPLATVLLWRRLDRRSMLPVLGRVGLLLGSQLAAVALIAAAANDYGYFYGSWSQLLGVAPAARVVLAASTPVVGRAAERRALTVAVDRAWSSPSQFATRGEILAADLTGVRSQLHEHAYVFLPPAYFARANRNVAFPAVEVFTGWPGNELALIRRLQYPATENAAVKAGRMHPTVLVMLSPALTGRRDTECTDVPAGPQAETFLAQDLPTAIVHGFRVLPTTWGAIGDSTGGYCATKLAMLNSNVFPAAVSLSGYYYALRDHMTNDLWGGSRVLRDENDLEWRLAHMPPPPVALYLTSDQGETGRAGYPDLRKFAALVKPPMSVTTVVLSGGGHNFSTWRRVIPPAMSWLSAQLSRAAHIAAAPGQPSRVARMPLQRGGATAARTSRASRS